jgi:hypothetical protein
MAEAGYIQLIEYRAGGWKKIRYQSIVDWCDRLREEYAIPDRRPPLSSPILRHKDEDLLPFPLLQSISTEDAMIATGYQHHWTVNKLCEEGHFECYRLHPEYFWRINLPSFRAWLDKWLAGVAQSGRAPRLAPVSKVEVKP